MGVTLANPEKAKDVNLRILFNFRGKEEVSATVVIDMGKINVYQEQKARQIWSSTQTRGLDKIP